MSDIVNNKTQCAVDSLVGDYRDRSRLELRFCARNHSWIKKLLVMSGIHHRRCRRWTNSSVLSPWKALAVSKLRR